MEFLESCRKTGRRLLPATAFLWATLAATVSHALPSWSGHGGNAQHTALSAVASNALSQILWQTPVDLQPQYSFSGDLLAHYGCPLVTALNTIVIPVKVGVLDSFRVEARKGGSGLLLWQFDSDYTLPAHNWIPSYSPALTPAGRLYIAGAGGTILYASNVDTLGTPTFKRVAFFGNAAYQGNPAGFNSDIHICTPLTSDSQGNIYFAYRATGSNPLGILDGIARIAPNDSAVYVSAVAATAGAGASMLLNAAPALSNGGDTLYVAIRRAGLTRGYLVALDAATLATRAQVLLLDPRSGSQANLNSNGTSSPMIAPDGKVYFGVLENPSLSNNLRGWLLAFNSNLTSAGVPGSFGWDDTPSLVPAGMVSSYHGASAYLLMVKYNNYAGVGSGDGVNRLAVLDPNASQQDTTTGVMVMKEALTIAGPTPDPGEMPTYPNAVKEWCINSAAVDPQTHGILAGSEDGKLYRWDTSTNAFTESVTLTSGLGAAYTPTVIGRDGAVYAINNATLYAVGVAPVGVDPAGAAPTLSLAQPHPNPFDRTTSLRFSLNRADRVILDVLDVDGRRVARLVDRELPGGNHQARWEGRAEDGARCPVGVYFARLTVGARSTTRKLVLAR